MTSTHSSKQRAFTVALTGGIASGKSTVAELFSQLGAVVLDTDLIARQVVEPGKPALAKLVEEFGADILDTSGRLDRRRMRERVFADAAQRRALEAVLHPAIREEIARQAAAAQGPYQIHMIPLLVETARSDRYDRVLVVDCPEQEQIRRVMSRDQVDREQALRILAAQATREQRLSVADDIIVNSGDTHTLKSQVGQLHQQYLNLAQIGVSNGH